MQVGDRVLLWQGGRHAGIYAVGEVTGSLKERAAGDDSLPGDHPAATKPVIPYRVTQILDEPVGKEVLLHHPVLKELQVIRFPQGTNFKVTAEQWDALAPLLAGRSPRMAPSYSEPTFEQIRQAIARQGLWIHEQTLQRYHLSLRVRGFVILAGISGTGKTWLTDAYSQAVGAHYQVVAVAPNWNTNEDLLGYFNPLDRRYYDTPFSHFLRQASEEYQRTSTDGRRMVPYHLVLDEMNLARVEYYFAKFLSALEERKRKGVAEVDLGPGQRVLLPPNLFFIGTVNVDETTHGFADKVYDRAQLVELDAPREALSALLGNVPYHDDVMEIWDAVHDVAPFAFRVIADIKTYIREAAGLGVSWEVALDQQLLQKILPRFKGADQRVGAALERMAQLTADQFPLTHHKASAMFAAFTQYGFASYF
jgi:MoxR-like ATPase